MHPLSARTCHSLLGALLPHKLRCSSAALCQRRRVKVGSAERLIDREEWPQDQVSRQPAPRCAFPRYLL
eukprot:2843960-Amphidinium_carterae.1